MAKPPKNNGGNNVAAIPPEGALVGTAGDDVIDATSSPVASTPGDDVIWGLEGNDVIDAGEGNDTIEAGAGDDTIYDSAGDDIINGGDGSDVIFNGAGSDRIDGGTGEGIDVVVYDGVDGVDYTYTYTTELIGKGRNQQEVITSFTVTDTATGDVDYITNVEQILFVQYPAAGDIITATDSMFTQYDRSVTLNVLDNDYIEGNEYGVGLELSAILDVQIDLDGDGVNDVDLIPDAAESDLTYFATGALLNDGSILTVSRDGTITWDPNGVYDTDTGTDPGIYFWYEASDGAGAIQTGDVAITVSYPTPPGDIQFEDMVGFYDDFTAEFVGIWIYEDGPGGDFWISQLTSGDLDGLPYEKRDEGATSFDYDLDGDDEFRIWTDSDGTTHEMNVTRPDQALFDLGGMTFGGLDAGETATIALWDGAGNYAEVAITEADLDPDGLLEFTNASGLTQFSVVAGTGDDFFVDDVFLL